MKQIQMVSLKKKIYLAKKCSLPCSVEFSMPKPIESNERKILNSAEYILCYFAACHTLVSVGFLGLMYHDSILFWSCSYLTFLLLVNYRICNF